MSKVCQITGKKLMVGNNVSHSKRRTKRKFYPNLFSKKFYDEVTGEFVSLKVSAHGMRIINKVGVNKAVKEAKANGYIK